MGRLSTALKIMFCLTSFAVNANAAGTEEIQALSFSLTTKGFEINQTVKLKNKGDYQKPTKFSVEIAGRDAGTVVAVDGFEHSHETVTYKDPEDQTTRQRPGNNKATRARVTREWSNDSTFIDWYKTVLAGQVDRRSITVTLLADDGTPTVSLNFYGCSPDAQRRPWITKSHPGQRESETIDLICDPSDSSGTLLGRKPQS